MSDCSQYAELQYCVRVFENFFDEPSTVALFIGASVRPSKTTHICRTWSKLYVDFLGYGAHLHFGCHRTLTEQHHAHTRGKQQQLQVRHCCRTSRNDRHHPTQQVFVLLRVARHPTHQVDRAKLARTGIAITSASAQGVLCRVAELARLRPCCGAEFVWAFLALHTYKTNDPSLRHPAQLTPCVLSTLSYLALHTKRTIHRRGIRTSWRRVCCRR